MNKNAKRYHVLAISLSALAVFAGRNAIAQAPRQDNLKAEVARLQGKWVAVSQEYGPELHELKASDQKPVWEFSGSNLTIFSGDEQIDTVRFEVRPGEMPKHLDLIPPPGEQRRQFPQFLVLTKLIYQVDGDELKVAFSFVFAPMQPEEEEKLAIKLAGTRPNTFDTNDADVAVTRFRRAKPAP